MHDARKDLKRSRTALRLLRPILAKPLYRRENAVLRDAAHVLNPARDAKVLTQTLQSLRRTQRTLRRNAAVTELLRTLRADQEAVRRSLREHPARLAHTRSALDRLRGRATDWRVGTHGWSVLRPAVQRIYAGGRRGLASAVLRPTDRALHEWRKQVKYLRYALEILQPIRARKLERLARQTAQLSDRLGEAHDLVMLAQKTRIFVKDNRTDLTPLLAIIDQQRRLLNLEALARGERLYGVKPNDWARQLEHHWRRWRRAD